MAATLPSETRRSAPLPSAYTRGDVGAAVLLVVLSLALFGPHLLNLSLFVGNSDRLHNFVSMREYQVDSWQTIGRIPTWIDSFLLGIPVYGFHWMVMPLDVVGATIALFPSRDVFWLSGYTAALHVAVGAVAAYLFIRDIVRSPFPAAVGAALYVCSVLPIEWIAVHEPAFAIFTLQPLGLLALRKARPGRMAIPFLCLTAVIVALVGFGLLQAVPYVLVAFGLYAAYRFVTIRAWRPIVLLGAASVVGILISGPRLGTAIEDFRELSRSASIQSTCPCEVLRWLDDGIFGRYPEEALALGNDFNMHEGLQIYSSAFAAAGVMVMLLRPRGGASVTAGIGLLVTLVALSGVSIGGTSFGALLMVAVGVLALWARARPGLARRVGMSDSYFNPDPDLRFFILLTMLGFAIVLSDGLRYLVYVAFFRIDFTHARMVTTVLLPLATLAAVFVDELDGTLDRDRAWAGARHLLALVIGGALAVGLVLLLDVVSPIVTATLFGAELRVQLALSYLVSTREVGRLLAAAVLFSIALWLNWIARHVSLQRDGDPPRLRWRHGDTMHDVSLLRLVPAYALGGMMVAQAFGSAYFQLNGDHTRTYPVPFVANNHFTAPANVLVPPSPAARQALHDRLQTDDYRSVTVSASDGYPTYEWRSERGYATFVAMFWQLRLANGYLGLSQRIAALPWPDASRTLRAISFPDQRTLPWPLLAALNVKYAVVASPSLLFNVPAVPARVGAEASPDDLTILENPLPVVPRAFFAAAVTPVVRTKAQVTGPRPGSPIAVRAVAISDRQILLSWGGEVADARYQVVRRQLAPTAEADSRLIAETGRGEFAIVDPDGEPGGSYEYQLRACDQRGCSELSRAVPARLAVAGIESPRLLSIEARSPTEAVVSWEPTDASASTSVEVTSGASGLVGEPMLLPPGTRSYTVTGLQPLRDYGVRLRACTAVGCSPHTDQRLVSMPSALTADELAGVIPPDPARESLVEGLDAPLSFESTGGPLRATYQGDRISIEVEPSGAQRFLVVNELYHPNWHAYAVGPSGNTELKVWPTNVVMRGVVVPPGVSQIEMRFEPFFVSWAAGGLVAAGLLLAVAGWWALRRVDKRWEAPRESRRG